MTDKDEINYMGITRSYFLSEDTYPKFLKENNLLNNKKMKQLPVEYPSELLIGDQDKETNSLVRYFEAKKWKYSWDFDSKSKTYWYDIYAGDRIVLQIEFEETVPEMIKAIKELIPKLKNVKDFDENTPNIMKKYLKEIGSDISVYVGDWDGK